MLPQKIFLYVNDLEPSLTAQFSLMCSALMQQFTFIVGLLLSVTGT